MKEFEKIATDILEIITNDTGIQHYPSLAIERLTQALMTVHELAVEEALVRFNQRQKRIAELIRDWRNEDKEVRDGYTRYDLDQDDAYRDCANALELVMDLDPGFYWVKEKLDEEELCHASREPYVAEYNGKEWYIPRVEYTLVTDNFIILSNRLQPPGEK